MQGITPVVKNLLLINFGIFFVQNFMRIDLIDGLGLRYILSSFFKPYQILTHLFVHANFSHLGSNMLALFTFGPLLEHLMTAKRFITFYLFTGIGASLLYTAIQYVEFSQLEALYHSYLIAPNPQNFVAYLGHYSQATYNSFYPFITDFFKHPDNVTYIAKSKAIVEQLYTLKINIPTVGASGAVFGIFTAFALLFPNAKLFLFFVPIPIKAKYVIGLYGIYELYAGISNHPNDQVAHFAHLGGILLAYLFIKRWMHRYS